MKTWLLTMAIRALLPVTKQVAQAAARKLYNDAKQREVLRAQADATGSTDGND